MKRNEIGNGAGKWKWKWDGRRGEEGANTSGHEASKVQGKVKHKAKAKYNENPKTRRDTHAGHRHRRVPEEEELVEPGDDNRPNEAECPRAQGRDGDGRVVRVRDGGADLGVRRILNKCQTW
jgi:hypothetical protein